MSIFNLSNEVAIVIGGTGVLGGAIAEALAAEGASVVVAGRSKERGEHRAETIRANGGKAVFLPVDASNRKSLRELDVATAKAFQPATILVNAAGGNDPKVTVTPDNPFDTISTEAILDNIDLNLLGGALIPCQEIGRGFCERGGGSIINIASVSAYIPLSRVFSYSAAKAGVINLTKFLAREWAPQGVRVNSITPGFFPAEQNRKLLYNDDGTPTPRAQSILGHTSMSRFGEPKELAGAVVFLASSKASSFVTGTDIRVDGGFLSQTL